MSTLPLVAHTSLDDVFARIAGRSVRVRQFLGDVQTLAARLPARRFVLPLTADRYRFAVGLAAAMVRGQISLLPPNRTHDTLVRMRELCEDDLIALVDEEAAAEVDLPVVGYAPSHSAPSDTVPQIEAAQCVAWVFTSGSTGTPMPHAKSWGALTANIDAAAGALGLIDHPGIVGTVPAQHMYGFESTVLLAFRSRAVLTSERPFYPADIASALARLPHPRMLVTTPFHLRATLEAKLAMPRVDRIVCATAPLSTELAREAENAFGGSLMEIYGCTESGQIAARRTCETDVWTTMGEVDVFERDHTFYATGGHVGAPVPLADVLALDAPTRFRLVGRSQDMINIAGKRTSLAHLNHHLNAIPGVRDGTFFAPDEPVAGGVARLVAFVVAPGLPSAQILAALRLRIDEAFLPRPLVLVDALPRSATGKLPREALAALAADHA